MKTLGYYNGQFGEIAEMTVPMTDRACWFGDGVYDAGLSRDYHMVFLDEHIDRFFRGGLFGRRGFLLLAAAGGDEQDGQQGCRKEEESGFHCSMALMSTRLLNMA